MESSIKKSNFIQFISYFLFNLYVIYGLISGYILVTSDALIPFVLALLTVDSLFALAIIFNRKVISLYVRGLFIFLLAVIALMVQDLISVTAAFVFIPLISYSIKLYNFEHYKSKLISEILVILFMGTIGKMYLLITQPSPAAITIEYLPDKMSAIGLPTPITEYYGLFITTAHGDILIGPLVFFVIFAATVLLVENYHLIIPLYVKSLRGSNKIMGGIVSSGYGVVAAMSCQCESAIALLPAVAILLLNILLIPFFILSVTLLAFTYLFIIKYYNSGRPNLIVKPIKMKTEFIVAIVLLLILQGLLPLILLLKEYDNIIYFFIYGMAMILSGFLFGDPLAKSFKGKLNKVIIFILFILSLINSLIWFFPYFTLYAYENPLNYSIMSYSMFLAGFLIGMVYEVAGEHLGVFFLEVFSVALGIIPIILYYYAFTVGVRIWKFWSLNDQIIISLILWIIMLPIMWIITQKSLYEASKRLFITSYKL